ncbi:MAG: hypothetical protein FWF06_01395 [Symbiobacteriaceae bacterium]|nr:hypothetical protein [Symbiobacteriaceae bacterium]
MSNINSVVDELFPVRDVNQRADPKKTLGKDDFLQLFLTQLTHQNPMEPINNDQFISQMAQFTALEQATNTASSLTKLLALQEENNELLAMLLYAEMGSVSRLLYESSTLIGRTVICRRGEEPAVQGVVRSVSLNNGEAEVYLNNGQSFLISEITEITG